MADKNVRIKKVYAVRRAVFLIALSLILAGLTALLLIGAHRRNSRSGQTADNTSMPTEHTAVDVLLSDEPVEQTQAAQTVPPTEAASEAADTAAPVNSPELTPELSDEPTSEPTAEATAEPTQAPQVTAVPTDSSGYPVLHSSSGSVHYYGDSGVFRVDNAAFEPFGYVDSVAEQYTGIVNSVAARLSGRAQVYSLVIPTGFGVTLPDDVRPKVQYYSDQAEKIEAVLTRLSSSVKAVRCWSRLMTHRNEYIYFRTDHHWTQRGAYYAYEAFCAAKGITPYTLSQRQEVTYPGFLGTFYATSNNDSALLPADTLYAYLPVSSSATMRFFESDGTVVNWPIVNNVSQYKASAKYAAFAGGDHGLTEFTNPDVSGGVLIVIKDSFGNALLPMLVDHYSKIYEIDHRYWSGNLIQFAIEKGATDILFAHNIQTVSARSTIAKLVGMTG